jgi:hypothetical protein
VTARRAGVLAAVLPAMWAAVGCRDELDEILPPRGATFTGDFVLTSVDNQSLPVTFRREDTTYVVEADTLFFRLDSTYIEVRILLEADTLGVYEAQRRFRPITGDSTAVSGFIGGTATGSRIGTTLTLRSVDPPHVWVYRAF